METEERTVSAEEVVAPGRTPQSMQFPSPVYFARWIDERHAVIGAGGGGRRFGMANLLALVAVDSTARPAAEKSPGESVWRFIAAVDLDSRIPWCASKFLPCEDDAARVRGVVGYVAVSHVTSFSLIELSGVGALSMRVVASVSVPSDTRNPDKKPIAIVQGAVAVAHDENGIWIFRLSSLTSSSGNGVVTRAEPMAKWALPARVNDLDADRFFVPKRDANAVAGRSRRLLSNYLLLAALVQDKTLRFASLKLRERGGAEGQSGEGKDKGEGKGQSGEDEDEDGEGEDGGDSDGLAELSVLTGKDCRIPFSLMRSSMRLVRLFGVESVPAAAARAAWRRARREHCAGGRRGAMPVASAVLVAYDIAGNRSHMLAARVASTAARGDAEGKNAEGKRVEGKNAEGKRVEGKNAAAAPRRRLALEVRFAAQPSIVAADAVTSIGACHSCEDAAALAEGTEGAGTAIPPRWLAATVEGSVVLVAYNRDGTFEALNVRPAKNKRAAARFPALHREPISCVAVSGYNDVLTTDIAQNVFVSALPYAEQLTTLTALKETSPIAPTSMRTTEHPHKSTDPQGGKVRLQSKHEFLSLFESETNAAPFAFHWVCWLLSKHVLLAALIVVPLIAIFATCYSDNSTTSRSFDLF